MHTIVAAKVVRDGEKIVEKNAFLGGPGAGSGQMGRVKKKLSKVGQVGSDRLGLLLLV
jgi:hypothetical protein